MTSNFSAPPENLSLSDITIDSSCQVRAELNQDTVASYAAVLREGGVLPPIKVYRVADGRLILVDGYHRREATLQAFGDKTQIQVEVHHGSMASAQWAAITANLAHGLPLNQADKRTAIKRILLHPNGNGLSSRNIAKMVGCSDHTVSAVKDELAQNSGAQNAHLTNRVNGQDGKSYPAKQIHPAAKPEKPAELPPVASNGTTIIGGLANSLPQKQEREPFANPEVEQAFLADKISKHEAAAVMQHPAEDQAEALAQAIERCKREREKMGSATEPETETTLQRAVEKITEYTNEDIPTLIAVVEAAAPTVVTVGDEMAFVPAINKLRATAEKLAAACERARQAVAEASPIEANAETAD